MIFFPCMQCMYGCVTVHEFVLSHEFVCTGASTIHTQYIYPYVDSPEFDARDGRRDNDDERPFRKLSSCRQKIAWPIYTFVCMDDELIIQTILAVVYFRSAGELPYGHWSVAKKVYETGEAADNIQVHLISQTVYTSYNYCCTWWVGKWWVYAPY